MIDDRLERITQRASRRISAWWLYLVCGAALAGIGVAVLFSPGRSFHLFSLFFGLTFIFCGLAQGWLSFSSGNYFMTSMSLFLLILFDLTVGILIVVHPHILSFILGLWLLYRALFFLSIGLDLARFKARGALVVTVLGIVLTILSCLIIVQPDAWGESVTATLIGAAFMASGAVLVLLAFLLRRIRSTVDAYTEFCEEH